MVAETYDFSVPAGQKPGVPQPLTPTPAPTQDTLIHLPVLGELADAQVCEPVVEIGNPDTNSDDAIAVLMTWGEEGFCSPQSSGPLKVECSGVIQPGKSWTFFNDQIPAGAVSAEVYSFTPQQLSQLSIDLGFDDTAGEYMCETLFFGVVGDADDYRRFKLAYKGGNCQL